MKRIRNRLLRENKMHSGYENAIVLATYCDERPYCRRPIDNETRRRICHGSDLATTSRTERPLVVRPCPLSFTCPEQIMTSYRHPPRPCEGHLSTRRRSAKSDRRPAHSRIEASKLHRTAYNRITLHRSRPQSVRTRTCTIYEASPQRCLDLSMR